MATDVDVQYFSHLNGLTLGNNWGDLIRLLDKALVTGIDFTQITAASIDAQGDVHITLYAAHNAMLFQVVELEGFTPASLNQKYRIKGVPNTTQLILKPKIDIAERTITTIGVGKLASLGYEILFRDTDDVKRVYRAKNPTAQHPFIRIDESLASDTGSYTSTYAKYAIVGLLEHMGHIDDYQNPDVLQLPFNPSSPAKNWNITGTGGGVVRGWARWYWASSSISTVQDIDSNIPKAGNHQFTICGDRDVFYLSTSVYPDNNNLQTLYGAGLYNNSFNDSLIPNWMLMANLLETSASVPQVKATLIGGAPLMISSNPAKFLIPKYNVLSPISSHVFASPITPDSLSGRSGIYSGSDLALLEIPFSDTDNYLRGSLKHVFYAGSGIPGLVTPKLSGSSKYLQTPLVATTGNNVGGVCFYLGELE